MNDTVVSDLPTITTESYLGTEHATVDVVRSASGLLDLRSEWNDLLERHPGRNPFLTYSWMSSWATTLGRKASPFVIVVRERGRVIAIAPFCLQGRQLTFMGYPRSDYADLIVDPEFPRAVDFVVDALVENHGLWKKAVLDQFMEGDSQWRALRDALDRRAVPYRLEIGDRCPAMLLQDREAARKQYYKRNITTYVNWFQSQGRFDFEIAQDLPASMQLLEALFKQHVERWDHTETPSPFLDEDMRDFYRAFVDAMVPRGLVRLASLRLDDRYPSLYLFFEQGKKMYLYKTCYDVAFAKRSPGQVILRYLFDYATEHGIEEMDYARGCEGYKCRFSNVDRHNRRFILYRTERSRRLADAVHSLRRSRLADVLFRSGPARSVRRRLLGIRRG